MSILLPRFVQNKFLEGEKYIIKQREQVSVIFIYILNFDELCETHKEAELVELLNKIFMLLDRSCEQYGVTKIETVGNCYMACAGLTESEMDVDPELLKINHGQRCLLMGIDCLQRISN